MSTHPFIPLYVDDYDAATAHLTVEEDGVYSRLIRLTWRTPGCSLPNDLAWIARKVRVANEDIARILEPVLAEFFTLQRGRLIQRRLKREYDHISRKKTARKLAGKKGGDAKALKSHAKSPSNATDLPPHTRAFPEPEPEPEPEKKEEPTGAQVLTFGVETGGVAAARRGSRLPADWSPASADIAYAMREHEFTQAEAQHIGESFRDYWHAAAGQKASKLDWSATWRNWIRTEAQRRAARRPAQVRQSFV